MLLRGILLRLSFYQALIWKDEEGTGIVRCFLVFLLRRSCFRNSKTDDDVRTQRVLLGGICLWHLLCGDPVKTGGMEDQNGDSASECSVCTVWLKAPDGGREENKNGTLSCNGLVGTVKDIWGGKERNVSIALCIILHTHFMWKSLRIQADIRILRAQVVIQDKDVSQIFQDIVLTFSESVRALQSIWACTNSNVFAASNMQKKWVSSLARHGRRDMITNHQSVQMHLHELLGFCFYCSHEAAEGLPVSRLCGHEDAGSVLAHVLLKNICDCSNGVLAVKRVRELFELVDREKSDDKNDAKRGKHEHDDDEDAAIKDGELFCWSLCAVAEACRARWFGGRFIDHCMFACWSSWCLAKACQSMMIWDVLQAKVVFFCAGHKAHLHFWRRSCLYLSSWCLAEAYKAWMIEGCCHYRLYVLHVMMSFWDMRSMMIRGVLWSVKVCGCSSLGAPFSYFGLLPSNPFSLFQSILACKGHFWGEGIYLGERAWAGLNQKQSLSNVRGKCKSIAAVKVRQFKSDDFAMMWKWYHSRAITLKWSKSKTIAAV